ncbi:MFS general substrate transporter [Hymenopellis radicata]|nr:MFS general substrate transporter [Hymenopellis radicata]
MAVTTESIPEPEITSTPTVARGTDEDEKSVRAAESEPPDGGTTAWLVTLAIFGINLGQGGYLVAWGTFQAFYEDTFLSGSSSSAIAWIGSIQYALDYTPGVLAGRLLDAGYFRATLFLSCVALTVANFTVPECHTYYQFVLSQSILYGIGSGFLYTPCLAIISHYCESFLLNCARLHERKFAVNKKRPIAYAIVTAGSAIGGVLYPIMFRRLEPSIGFPWTMRFFAFFQLVFFTFGVLVIKPRQAPPRDLPRLLDLRGVVTSSAYISYVFAVFLAFMALFTPLTYMTVKANQIGLSADLSFYLISIVNAATIPGRILCGFVANKFGALNLTIATTVLSVGFILGWAVTESRSTYIGMAICYGISTGGFLGLYAVPVAQMGTVEDTGRRTGVQMTILSIGALIGPPISGAIQGNQSDFTLVGVFAAVTMVGSTAFMILAKKFYLGRVWTGIF